MGDEDAAPLAGFPPEIVDDLMHRLVAAIALDALKKANTRLKERIGEAAYTYVFEFMATGKPPARLELPNRKKAKPIRVSPFRLYLDYKEALARARAAWRSGALQRVRNRNDRALTLARTFPDLKKLKTCDTAEDVALLVVAERYHLAQSTVRKMVSSLPHGRRAFLSSEARAPLDPTLVKMFREAFQPRRGLEGLL